MIKRLLAKMFVRNVRLGFATNSSSSHSLVFYAPGMRLNHDQETAGLEFGWNHFVAADLHTKMCYGLLSMSDVTWGDSPYYAHKSKEEALQFLADTYVPILGAIPDVDPTRVLNEISEAMDDKEYGYPHVDHQSRFGAGDYGPLANPEDERLRFLQVLADDRVVVHGGNDNGGTGPGDFVNAPGVEQVRSTWRPFDNYTPYWWEAPETAAEEDLPSE